MPDKDKYVTAKDAAAALGLAGLKAFELFLREHSDEIAWICDRAGTQYRLMDVLRASADELKTLMVSTRTLAQRVGLSRQRVLEYVHTQRLRPSAHRAPHRGLLFTPAEADRFAKMLQKI